VSAILARAREEGGQLVPRLATWVRTLFSRARARRGPTVWSPRYGEQYGNSGRIWPQHMLSRCFVVTERYACPVRALRMPSACPDKSRSPRFFPDKR
jgi:hypothetical protein